MAKFAANKSNFSLYQKRSVAPKLIYQNALAAGAPPQSPPGELMTLPRPLVGWGGGHPCLYPTTLGDFGASILDHYSAPTRRLHSRACGVWTPVVPLLERFRRRDPQTSHWGFAPDPNGGAFIPRLPDPTSSQIMDPPLVVTVCPRTFDWTDYTDSGLTTRTLWLGRFIWASWFLVPPSLLFLFKSVRQTKLAIRQLFGARKYSVSHRIVSWTKWHLTQISDTGLVWS